MRPLLNLGPTTLDTVPLLPFLIRDTGLLKVTVRRRLRDTVLLHPKGTALLRLKDTVPLHLEVTRRLLDHLMVMALPRLTSRTMPPLAGLPLLGGSSIQARVLDTRNGDEVHYVLTT